MWIKKGNLGIFSLTLFLFNCATLQQFVKKPTVAFQKTELGHASFSESTLIFHFHIQNPNPISITARKFVYHLNLNGKPFLQGTVDQGIHVQARGTAPFQLPVTIEYFNFFKSIQEFLQSKRVDYELKGSITIGPFDIPYQTAGQLPVPELPDLSLQRVTINNISFTGASLTFLINSKNSNAFSIKPTGLHYNIALADIPFASGNVENIETWEADRETTLKIPLHISFLKLGQSAYQLLTKSASGYQLTGNLLLHIPNCGLKQFPFQKTGKVSLKR
jgi:LEA14-like dessication related protein